MPEKQTTQDCEEPPADVQSRVEQLRHQDVIKLIATTEIFPRQFLSLVTHRERTRHLVTVVRYWLAHPDSGLESFRGEKTKRLKAYHWTCSDAGISLSQVENEVAETYTPAEDPHKKFTEDIQKFEEMFNDRLEYC